MSMARSLHITNGDSAADLIIAAGIASEVLPWRDPMHHGPFPAALELEELSRRRIAYLSNGSEGTDATTGHGFTLRDATLARCSEYDEVVLWFEHDLLDQLQILQILDYLSPDKLGQEKNDKLKLSIICIDRFEGVNGFRGLGQLSPEQITSLFPGREGVTQTQFQSAVHCWEIFRQPSPVALQALIAGEIPGLPFMRAALHRHCQEFAWLQDGLTRTERQLLELVAAGEERPVQLFIKNMEFENFLYIGDTRTYSVIKALCHCDNPLLQLNGKKPLSNRFLHPYYDDVTADEFKAQRLKLSHFGQQVLAGAVDVTGVMVRDEWLGGVQPSDGQDCWYWDEANQVFDKR